jgi:uncharacterized protein YcfL
MKQLILLAVISIMFVSCVNTNQQEEVNEEVILNEQSADSTEVEQVEFLETEYEIENKTEAQEEVTE